MMKIGRGIEVLDPYEWLPGHGENAVNVRTEGTDLIVTIQYDSDAGECERELRCASACSFYSQLFPGPSMLEVEERDVALLLRGVLVEYPDSDAAKAWVRHFVNSRDVRHYSIAFVAENLLLEVLASDVSLGEPTIRSI
ncbi:hypothetical protein [Paraburkholderia adhaesiva]|uniref:hypothetical protein n=1 Tax=Paraburkholderia adhaesiva TaxID=2883244 RepID=UPI001F30B6F8|nr:hypothetical protein [Paraburkholderia adhaesiva]